MGSLNFVLHPDDLTLTKLENYRLKALAAGYARALGKGIGNKSDVPGFTGEMSPETQADAVYHFLLGGNLPKSIDVKEMELSVVDLVVAPTLDRWITAVLAAPSTAYTLFGGLVAPQLQDQKVAVFWGIECATIPLPVNRLLFRQQGVAGNILAQFDLETIESKRTLEGIFSEPVVIDPRGTFAVQVLSKIATGAGAQIKLNNFIFEAQGKTVA